MVKNLPANAEDTGSIPGLEDALEEEMAFLPGGGILVQYSCLENSTDRGAWWAPDHGISKSQT